MVIDKDLSLKCENLDIKKNNTSFKNSNTEELSNEVDVQEKFQKDPSSYNGAIRENYTWTQSIKDVDIRVKVLF